MYTEIIETIYGKMIVPSTDKNQVQYYKQNQKHIDHDEIDFLVTKLHGEESPVIVDCGSNVGFFTFGMNKGIRDATFYTFEAQRIIFNMVCGSVSLNCFENIFVFNNAVSSIDGEIFKIPRYNYSIASNFGSVEVEREKGSENIGQSSIGSETIMGKTIDSLNLEKCNLIKIDIEGMEERAIEGAIKTISKFKPILFIEYIKSNKNKLVARLTEMGYNITELKNNLVCLPK